MVMHVKDKGALNWKEP